VVSPLNDRYARIEQILAGAFGGWFAGFALAIADVFLTISRQPFHAETRDIAQMLWVALASYPVVGALCGLAIGSVADPRERRFNNRAESGRALSMLAGTASVVYGLAYVLFRMPRVLPAIRIGIGLAIVAGSAAIAAFTWKHRSRWSPSRPIVVGFLTLWIGVVALSGLTSRRAQASIRGGKPGARNVILVTVDTLRADALGCYGNRAAKTPNIDRLAHEGALFLHAQAASSWTLPSHASMFTGLTVPEHGADSFSLRLTASHATVAEVLRDDGFVTAAITSSIVTGQSCGLGRGFTYLDDEYGSPWRWLAGPGLLRKVARFFPILDVPAERRAAGVIRRALPFLQSAGGLFLWLHFFDPHTDYDPPAPFCPPGVRGAPGPFDGKGIPLGDVNLGRLRKPDPVDLKRLRMLYDGEVAYVDSEIGRLRTAIDAAGAAGRTAILLVSDHGEAFLEHGRMIHATLHQEILRVPLIVWAPGVVPAGLMVPRVVRGVDVAPTVAELAGVRWRRGEAPEAVSLLSVLRGEQETTLLARSDREEEIEPSVLVRESSLLAWPSKLLVQARQPLQLFNLDSDPAERTNLALEEPRLVTELMARLQAGRASLALTKRREIDDELRRRLRSLGYLQ
jgi:arylsulfatase A-like enzyme